MEILVKGANSAHLSNMAYDRRQLHVLSREIITDHPRAAVATLVHEDIGALTHALQFQGYKVWGVIAMLEAEFGFKGSELVYTDHQKEFFYKDAPELGYAMLPEEKPVAEWIKAIDGSSEILVLNPTKNIDLGEIAPANYSSIVYQRRKELNHAASGSNHLVIVPPLYNKESGLRRHFSLKMPVGEALHRILSP